ncbi:MAG: hypothetical protein ACLGIN_12795 [Candidatus Sericytochromatia bacterium]
MQGFDLKGAAHDVELRAARWSRLLGQYPDLMAVYKMLTRNPWAAREAANAVHRIIASRPDRARSAEEPLFPEAS